MFNKWKVKVGIIQDTLPQEFVIGIRNSLNEIVEISIVDNVSSSNFFDILICPLLKDTPYRENQLTIAIYQTPFAYSETINFRVFDPEKGDKVNLLLQIDVFKKYFISIIEELKIPTFSCSTSYELL